MDCRLWPEFELSIGSYSSRLVVTECWDKIRRLFVICRSVEHTTCSKATVPEMLSSGMLSFITQHVQGKPWMEDDMIPDLCLDCSCYCVANNTPIVGYGGVVVEAMLGEPLNARNAPRKWPILHIRGRKCSLLVLGLAWFQCSTVRKITYRLCCASSIFTSILSANPI